MKKSSVVKYETENSLFVMEQLPNSGCLDLVFEDGANTTLTKEELVALHQFIGEVLFDLDNNIKLTVPEKEVEVPLKAPALARFAPGDH